MSQTLTAVKHNTWYQIHTNGGTTTFARTYEGHNDLQQPCWWFEKMSVDHTMSIIEVFGATEYEKERQAQDRLDVAIADAI